MTIYASDGTELLPDDTLAVTVTEEVTETVVDVEVTDDVSPVSEPDDTAADGDAVDAEVVTDLATVDEPTKWVHSEGWTYDWLEFKGDLLAVRIPHQNALTALYHASKLSDEFQAKMTEQFVRNHISLESQERVLARMIDPDDTEYADTTISGAWSDLLKLIGDIGGDRVKKDLEARVALESGKGKR